jgi:hypothetical protein
VDNSNVHQYSLLLAIPSGPTGSLSPSLVERSSQSPTQMQRLGCPLAVHGPDPRVWSQTRDTTRPQPRVSGPTPVTHCRANTSKPLQSVVGMRVPEAFGRLHSQILFWKTPAMCGLRPANETFPFEKDIYICRWVNNSKARATVLMRSLGSQLPRASRNNPDEAQALKEVLVSVLAKPKPQRASNKSSSSSNFVLRGDNR